VDWVIVFSVGNADEVHSWMKLAKKESEQKLGIFGHGQGSVE
jgi:hypothetical protein